jgi:hypothetical protein
MTNCAQDASADRMARCTCIQLRGCEEFGSPCPVCGERDAYDPCPLMGFGCGSVLDARDPCECCTPRQFENARRFWT